MLYGQMSGETLFVTLISFGGLLINFVAALVGGTWALSRSSAALYEKVNARFDQNGVNVGHKLDDLEGRLTATTEQTNRNFGNKIDDLEGRLATTTEQTTRDFGETITAIREKITQVELWGRDNFIDKLTFNLIIGETKESWRRFEEKMDRRLDKIDNKLDSRVYAHMEPHNSPK